MYLFYGVTGAGPWHWTRTITGVDATVLLAIVNGVVFVWFARELKRATQLTTNDYPVSL